MNSILLSIKPKWAALIYADKKDIEWRKSMPIASVNGCDDNEKYSMYAPQVYLYETYPVCKVTGFFEMCTCRLFYPSSSIPEDYLQGGMVPIEALKKYANGKRLYGWKIDEQHKFDAPKKISDFRNWQGEVLTRPPQSWCYVDGKR